MMNFFLTLGEPGSTCHHGVQICKRLLLAAGVLVLTQASAMDSPPKSKTLPNILLVLTDDQGFGDLGIKGNPHLRTPNLDAFAASALEMTTFYVSPVCSPTRASLLTGRYAQRTGVTDTWCGASTLHPDEVTLPEVLSSHGYATGLFGKWHLGDTYPYRPQDQGFADVLMHRGGGIGQPSDPPGGRSYFDPLLFHNGEAKRYAGYCMDVYTDAALAFLEAHQHQPFFLYLATNTPHSPLQVPERYWKPYRKQGLTETTSKVYGMVENIDDNFARLLTKLKDLDLEENTIVIFLSDNGPQIFAPGHRHQAGLRGQKTDVYEGGIRTPFYVRWPAGIQGSPRIDVPAAHIDLMPTLLEACGIPLPESQIDGRSMLPLWRTPHTPWPDRILFFQWHRGQQPNPYQNFTARGPRYKLLQQANKFDLTREEVFELYDLEHDPGETTNLADTLPEQVDRLRKAYDHWLRDIRPERGFVDMPSWIGDDQENPVTLTHQDRRSTHLWGTEDFREEDYWPVRILNAGKYTAKIRFLHPATEKSTAVLRIGDQRFRQNILEGADTVVLPSIHLQRMESALLRAWVEQGEEKRAAYQVTIAHQE